MRATSQPAWMPRYSRRPVMRPTKPACPVDPPAGPILALTWKNRGPPTAKPEPIPPKMPAANEAEVGGETLTANLLRKTSPHTEPTPAVSRPPESRLSRPGARVVCLWEKACLIELSDQRSEYFSRRCRLRLSHDRR